MAEQQVFFFALFCSTCGELCLPEGCTTGYGIDREGHRLCFDCCAARERERMIETGQATLYLTTREQGWQVTDWPGRLAFPTSGLSTSRHNFGGTRRDFWFNGPDHYVWHGYQIGGNSDLAHCKRTRVKVTSSEPAVNIALNVIRAEVA